MVPVEARKLLGRGLMNSAVWVPLHVPSTLPGFFFLPFKNVFSPVLRCCLHDLQMIKNSTDKNDDFDGSCKGGLTFDNTVVRIYSHPINSNTKCELFLNRLRS